MRRRRRTRTWRNRAGSSWNPPGRMLLLWAACYPYRGRATTEAAFGDDAKWVAAHAAAIAETQIRMRRRCASGGRQNKEAHDRRHALLIAPPRRRAMRLVGDFLKDLGQVCGFVVDDLVELLWCVGHADDELRRELGFRLG